MKSALLNLTKEQQLSGIIRQLYYDFKNLAYFDRYGASCFAMAALLSKLLTTKGYSARVQPCNAIFRHAGQEFLLGYQGYAFSGQVEGHVICVVDEKYVIDFGLGNVRKHFRENFYRAIACEMDVAAQQLASVILQNGVQVEWRTDWISPQVEIELKNQEPHLLPILETYERYKKNRIAFLIKRMFRNKSSRYNADAANHAGATR